MRGLRQAPPPPRFTRRRALAVGAAAGLGSLLRRPVPGWALGRRASLGSFGMDVPGTAFAGGRVTGVLRAPRRFDLFGARGAGLAGAGLEARVRPVGGPWSPWVPLGAGHAPDEGRSLGTTDPVWAGGADELQLRASKPLGGVRLVFVTVPAPSRAAAAGAQARAAGARTAQATTGAPSVITRDEWGAAAVPPRATPSYGTVAMAFVHHTVTANDYAPQDSASIVLGIAKYHRDTNGWNDIGYNFLVDKYGQVFEGREGGVDLAVVGAQAQGWNSQSTGIATLGTFEAVAFPAPGMTALARLIAWKLAVHGVPTQGTVALVSGGGSQNRWRKGATVSFYRIAGHRDGCLTTCPGGALYGQIGDLRTRAAALAGTIAVQPRLTILAASGTVDYGSDVALTGRFAQADGSGLGGARVDVQKLGASGTFSTIARTTTASDGSWSARLPWRRPGTLRAQTLTPATGARVRSVQVTVAIAAELSAAADATRVLVGRRAVLRGRAVPAGSVTVVAERQDAAGHWRRVAAARGAVSSGAYRVPVRLASAGLHRLTVRAGSGSTARSAAPVYVRAVRDPASLNTSASGATPQAAAGQAAPGTPAAAPPGTGSTGGMAAG
ncbi:MAG: hypothetical protein QOH43_210 [Solirubrobacteraceae bacterium]|nr:hypothetical protein [Solirubrobacteraceae bacterium]